MDGGSGTDVHVLHVDDEPNLTDLVAVFLEREAGETSLSVTTSNDGLEALDLLREAAFDCVVSDYDMPSIDGLEFLRAVRTEHPDLPFILFTGKGSEEVARDAFRVGATDYMQKDTGTDQYTVLANRVLNAVSQSRAQAASERYGMAIEALDSAVYTLDTDGTFVSVDSVFCELTGYDRESVLGKHVTDLAADGNELQSALTAALLDDASEATRFEAVFEAGPNYLRPETEILCEGHLTVRSTDDDLSILGTLQDVTDRRRQQERLTYETRLQDAVLDTSTSLTSAEADEIGTKIEWTLQTLGEAVGLDRCTVYRYDEERRAAACIHDWHADSVVAHPERIGIDDATWLLSRLGRFENIRIHHTGELPPEATKTKKLLRTSDTGGFVAVPMVSDWTLVGFVLFDHLDESRAWTDMEVDLLRTVADNVSNTLARQRRERELRRQNDRLEEFASVVSHDLRNPLNIAKGFVELAAEEDDVTYLSRSLDALSRMDTLLNDVLTLAREGRKVGETNTVSIDQIAERAWSTVETDRSKLSIDSEFDIVQADPGRLQQAFENLFRNAIQHGSTYNHSEADDIGDAESEDADSLTIHVGATPTGFYVADNGPGIPEAKRKTIFEHGHTTSESGSGFGLSIVKGIVEAHGWEIEATEPEPDLGGARFEIDMAAVHSDVDRRVSPQNN
ncbi:response regulator [Haloferax sp. DFSO60]|uniref:hybrid sensor histidine kinase/response regulator n=1 Tax=Haloferax sp. DFSO60 TaxID=3388652 RepID=UPI0039797108